MEHLHYEPKTGRVFRRPELQAAGGVIYLGRERRPYLGIGIVGGTFMLHRVIWKWMTGDDPVFIDHRDQNGLNNVWSNLRKATRAQNAWNACGQSNKKSNLPKGVYDNGRPGCFYAKVRANGVIHYLGRFPSLAEAHAAYCAAAQRLHGEFWNAG